MKTQEHLSHIFAALAETPPINTGDDFIRGAASSNMLVALRLQLLDARDLVARCAIITGDFGLDDNDGGDLIIISSRRS